MNRQERTSGGLSINPEINKWNLELGGDHVEKEKWIEFKKQRIKLAQLKWEM